MGKNTVWKQVASVPPNWQTFHTQGMVKIDRTLYVTAVKILEPTQRNTAVTTDALYDFSIDRSAGTGRCELGPSTFWICAATAWSTRFRSTCSSMKAAARRPHWR